MFRLRRARPRPDPRPDPRPEPRARRDGEAGEGRPLTRRAVVLLAAQLGIGAVLALRLRQLQIVESEKYRLLAEENRINLRLIPPERGEIFDRAGAPLALNRQNYRVTVVREQSGDVDDMLDRLGLIIDLPERQRQRAAREMRQKAAFVPVLAAEHLSWSEFAALNANLPALPGVQPEVGLSRHYPDGMLTAHIVGYVGRVTERELMAQETPDPVLQIPDFQIGKTGIERALEHELRGKAGTLRIEVNALGRVIREIDRNEGTPGADFHLTVDLGLQAAVAERLTGESAAAIVLDVTNGDLLAAVSSPGYDPNLFVRGISSADWSRLLGDPYRPLANKWASGLYPPGSTFKMVVALAALEAGVAGPGERVFCNGAMRLGNRRFHCWRKGGHGSLHMRQALEQSCDVYYYEMAKRLGIDRIAAMARRFGMGEGFDLPIPALKGGLIPSREWKKRVYDESWQTGDSLNSAIGQGFVLATPLQLAVMTARLATGRAVTPRLIRARGGIPLPDPAPEPLALRPADLELVQGGMFDVVNGGRGTARRSRIADEAALMAGKTGTSQVRNITPAERAAGIIRNEDLPWERRDHALFVCYAPHETPKYAVSVIVEHGGGGSAAAAPIARDVMLRALYGPEIPLRAYPPDQRPERPPPTPDPRPEAQPGPAPGAPRIRT
ncbi:MAG TPA: penicillin-binding protein 2 [Thermohalobaculum sp.]|nr:penicillin-binding protein 2 [Thermohalobaculum sp.]